MAQLKFILDGNGNKIYPITIANGVAYIKSDGSQVKLNEYLDALNTSLTGTSADKADKVKSATSGNFAGLDSNGNLTDSGSKAGDFATSAQGGKADSAIQTVKVNGTALTATSNAVDVTVAKGASDGYIKVNGTDIQIVDTTKLAEIGKSGDAKTADTIYGAKAYADDAVSTAIGNLAGALIYKGTVNANTDLPAEKVETGAVYVVATAGTYAGKAMEVGDYLIYNGSTWDGLNGENQVSNDTTDLEIGTAVKVATVDGVAINVKQVEDLTKLECGAVDDTEDYADVSGLFKTAAA